jgi:hypothetical protein
VGETKIAFWPLGSRARGECRRRRGGGGVATGEADHAILKATTGESCLRVLVARSAGGDAAAVMATGEADGATTGESCLRRGQWYAASSPFSSRALPGGTRRRDGPHHMFFFLQHHENRPRVKNQKPLLGRMRLSTLFARGLIFCRRRIWSKSPPARQAARPAPAPSQLRRALAP